MGDTFEGILRASADRRGPGAEVSKRNSNGGASSDKARRASRGRSMAADLMRDAGASDEAVERLRSTPTLDDFEALITPDDVAAMGGSLAEVERARLRAMLSRDVVWAADSLTVEQARTWLSLTAADRKRLVRTRADRKAINQRVWRLLPPDELKAYRARRDAAGDAGDAA